MSKTVLFTEYGTEFVKNEREEYFLSVLTGGIAQYHLTVMLSSEEVHYYHEFGDYYVQKLALDICHEPSKFEERQVQPS